MYDIVGEDMDTVSGVGEEPETAGDVGFFAPQWLRGLVPARPGAAAVARATPVATAAPVAPGAPAIMPRPVQGILRRQILPIPATPVGAGGTATITLQPQRAFRVERLVLSSTVKPSQIVVSDISVGAERQFVSAGDVPLEAFAPDAIGTGLRGDTAQPGTTVTLTLRNIGAAAETISGAFFGTSAE